MIESILKGKLELCLSIKHPQNASRRRLLFSINGKQPSKNFFNFFSSHFLHLWNSARLRNDLVRQVRLGQETDDSESARFCHLLVFHLSRLLSPPSAGSLPIPLRSVASGLVLPGFGRQKCGSNHLRSLLRRNLHYEVRTFF